MSKKKALFELRNAKINFLSLCKKGKNRFSTIYKSDDEGDHCQFSPITKFDDEKGELLALVYTPGLVDSELHTMTQTEIRKAMHSFAKSGMGIDIAHNEKKLPPEDIYVAESFEIQKGDPRFEDFTTRDGEEVDVTGGWAVILKIENEEIRKKYREGEYEGISMGGEGMKVPVTKEEEEEEKEEFETVLSYFKKMLGGGKSASAADKTNQQESSVMDKDLKDTLKQMSEGIEAIAKSVGAGAQEKEKTPENAIDPTDKEALEKQLETLKKAEEEANKGKGIDPTDVTALRAALQKAETADLDLTDPEAVKAHLAKLQKDQNEETPEQAEIRKLEEQLTRIKGKSGKKAGILKGEFGEEEIDLDAEMKVAYNGVSRD